MAFAIYSRRPASVLVNDLAEWWQDGVYTKHTMRGEWGDLAFGLQTRACISEKGKGTSRNWRQNVLRGYGDGE